MKIRILIIVLILTQSSAFSQGFNNDLAVVSLTSPAIVINPSNAVQVAATIYNNGLNIQSNFLIQYRVDGGFAVVNVCPVTLLPGMTYNSYFGDIADLSVPGCHTIEVSVMADQNMSNNRKVFNILVTNSSIFNGLLFPDNVPFWTGTTDSLSFTQYSIVQFSGGTKEVGWMMFDPAVLAGQSVISAQLHMKAHSPYNSTGFTIKDIQVNPLALTPELAYSSIKNAEDFLCYHQPVNPGQQVIVDLPIAACWRLTQMQTTGFFPLGFVENSNDTSQSGTFSGWDQGANRPFIVLYSIPTLAVDAGILTIDIDTTFYIPGLMLPQITVTNMGLANVVFSVTASSAGGYSSTVSSSVLVPGVEEVLTFDPFAVPPGPVFLNFSLNLPGDENCLNNQAEFCWNNEVLQDISGTVTYDNSWHSVMDDSTYVLLIPVNPPGLIQVDTVDSNGQYIFKNIPGGAYNLQLVCEKSWGGGTAVDALLVLRHFLGLSVLTGLRLEAADVSNNGIVNTLDALMIAKRHMLLITSFPAPDWISEQPFVSIPMGNPIPYDLKIICRGDVNGSNMP